MTLVYGETRAAQMLGISVMALRMRTRRGEITSGSYPVSMTGAGHFLMDEKAPVMMVGYLAEEIERYAGVI